MRLNKFLAAAGVASRRKADELIESGAIKVNGMVEKRLGVVINVKKDVVEYNDKIIKLPTEFVYFKLNKPKGYICSAKDTSNRKTIYELFNEPGLRLFSAGRLDYDTEGLLIVTNDGEFAQKLIHPSSSIEKEYYCTVEGEMKESELAVLRKGVVIDGERMPPAKVTIMNITKNKGGVISTTRLSVRIHEGQNRQIRRMFEAINKNIKLLKRVRIGEIRLGGLQRGKYKALTKGELECIGFYTSSHGH